jgi:uncharacterized repeat protein (TIGR03803 family)
MTRTTQQRDLISGALRKASSCALRLVLVLALGVATMQSVYAQTYEETVLHTFTGLGDDGANPNGPSALLSDGAGDFYGTTDTGGAWGYGTVFKIDSVGNSTVLYSFPHKGGRHKDVHGAFPNAGLAIDSAGNLYGTTPHGGINYGGTVFKLRNTRQGYKASLLHEFAGGANDGAVPLTGLIQDSEGNFYGATFDGGGMNDGVVFKMDNTGQVTVIYSIGDNPNEGTQVTGLTLDSGGNLYLASETGGPSQYFYNCLQRNYVPSFGCGSIAKIDPSGNETLLHVFTGVDGDGGSPLGSVVLDADGNIYGATLVGGTGSCQPSYSSTSGCGTVFKIDRSGNYSVIYNFSGKAGDGAGPIGGLTMDQAGNLYGTAESGGSGSCFGQYTNGLGCGVVFSLNTNTGEETLLRRFSGGRNGGNPEAGLFMDSSGSLFGTTWDGGEDNKCGRGLGCGVVFKLSQ